MADMEIEDDMVVTLHFTLRDETGEVIDVADATDPLVYLHGHENVPPGLEDALTAKKVGDRVEAKLSPAEGFGELTGDTESVPRSELPEDVEVGSELVLETDDGDVVECWVVSMTADEVVITADHPLAGKTLSYSCEVVEIRAATKEELDHGHPHGPGGHHH